MYVYTFHFVGCGLDGGFIMQTVEARNDRESLVRAGVFAYRLLNQGVYVTVEEQRLIDGDFASATLVGYVTQSNGVTRLCDEPYNRFRACDVEAMVFDDGPDEGSHGEVV